MNKQYTANCHKIVLFIVHTILQIRSKSIFRSHHAMLMTWCNRVVMNFSHFTLPFAYPENYFCRRLYPKAVYGEFLYEIRIVCASLLLVIEHTTSMTKPCRRSKSHRTEITTTNYLFKDFPVCNGHIHLIINRNVVPHNLLTIRFFSYLLLLSPHWMLVSVSSVSFKIALIVSLDSSRYARAPNAHTHIIQSQTLNLSFDEEQNWLESRQIKCVTFEIK